MSDPIRSPPTTKTKPAHRSKSRQHTNDKLPTLPSTAKIHKRPLLHPAIPSPYAGSSHPKVVYVSARTPFLSAVKRVEKLLRVAEKRVVQAATTRAKQQRHDRPRGGGGQKRKRGDEGDEVLEIAREVERAKAGQLKRRKADVEDDDEGVGTEEVLIKASGKAIAKALELGLWFQQREEYAVRLRTGSVGAIDDVEVGEEMEEGGGGGGGEASMDKVMEDAGAEAEAGDAHEDGSGSKLPEGGGAALPTPATANHKAMGNDAEGGGNAAEAKKLTPETRIRYVSTLEVAVSLR